MTSAKKWLLRGLLGLAATGAALAAVEGGLRLLPAPPKPIDYGDAYRTDGMGPGGFLRENFSAEVADGYGGTVPWRTNSQGFRNDQEFLIPPPAGSYRILSLGDSFTGGYRVGQQATFSAQLQNALAARFPDSKIEVLVAVIEDPLTGFYYLSSRGAAYEPRLVLSGITLGNDLSQIYANFDHGYALTDQNPFVARQDDISERDTWVAKIEAETIPAAALTERAVDARHDAPTWADVYPWWPRHELRVVSLVSQFRRRFLIDAPQTVVSNWEQYTSPRLFDSNGLGIFLKQRPEAIQRAYEQLFQTLAAQARYCQSHNFAQLVVIFPQRFQVQDHDWDKTVAVYGLRAEQFDLQLPNREIASFCAGHGIRVFDPTMALRNRYREAGRSLYLPSHDMHWNAEGHQVVAEALTPVIGQMVGEATKLPDSAGK